MEKEQREFEYDGYTCLVTYGGGLPAYQVDGAVVPCGVVREDDAQHAGEPMEFWVDALKDYLDSQP